MPAERNTVAMTPCSRNSKRITIVQWYYVCDVEIILLYCNIWIQPIQDIVLENRDDLSETVSTTFFKFITFWFLLI